MPFSPYGHTSAVSGTTVQHHKVSAARQRPRRQAAADASFSYAERQGSTSPEPADTRNRTLRLSSSARKGSSTTPLSARALSSLPNDMRRQSSTGSNRRESSSTPSEAGETPLTKTGRPSRALKGKKVHKCDICDRVYTRNEHLRRHQLNHSSEILRCPVEGCQKVFARADLLKRHRDEHANDDSVQFARRASASTRFPGRHHPPSPIPIPGGPFVSEHHIGVWPSTTAAFGDAVSFDGSRRASYFEPTSSDSSPMTIPSHQDSLPFIGAGVQYPDSFEDPSFSMLPLSSLPGEGFAQHSPLPGSPVSGVYQPWQPPHGMGAFSPTNSDLSGGSAPQYSGMADVNGIMPSGRTVFEEMDAAEESTILKEVAALGTSMPAMQGPARLQRLEAEYLESFWLNFDAMYSVVHRPSFEMYGNSPMVRGLMIAIGASYFDSDAAQSMARTLREACTKLIQRRPQLDYSRSRLCDLQAVFLHEVFSVFCSRRPCSRFSQRFEDLLTGLLSDRDNLYYVSPMVTLAELHTAMPTYEAEHLRFRWLELEPKRRLLLACYMLETQQKTMFGTHRPVSDMSLPGPCSQALWEAYTADEWQALCNNEPRESHSLSEILSDAQRGASGHLDSFTSHLAIAFSAHAAYFGAYGNGAGDARYPLAQTAQCDFNEAAAQLACSAPVQELLSVSGETFALGQKLATEEQFEAAVQETRAWASSSSTAQPAIDAARRMLKTALSATQNGGRVGLLHEDWALTLAALVLWATCMWPAQYSPGAMAAAASPADHAEEKARAALWAASPLEYLGARACLAYVRRRMDGRLGWLVQDGCGTLGKLVEGRVIDTAANLAAAAGAANGNGARTSGDSARSG